MGKSELTQKVLQFKKTGRGGKKLEKEIASIIYKSTILGRHLTEEQINSFICWFYPEILSSAKRFSYRGRPFEAYINYILPRRINSFLRKDLSKKEIQNIFEDSRFVPLEKTGYVNEDNICSTYHALQELDWLADAGDKRILYLFLKEYAISDPEKLSIVSVLTGYEEKWVQECGKRLRVMLYTRSKRYKIIKRRRNYTYYLLFRAERRLLKAVTETEKKILRTEIITLKKRLSTANAALEKISTTPTHREIAEVTGNPKGSVDSGLFYLKKSIRTIHDTKKKCA